jgi:hypothetical protein
MEVELFASETNHILPKFITRWPCERAIAFDAFIQDWSQWSLCYANPPFDKILQVIIKAQKDHANLLLIHPVWTTRPWWPWIKLASKTIDLPHVPDLFTNLDPSMPIKSPKWKAQASLFLFKDQNKTTSEETRYHSPQPYPLNPLFHLLPGMDHRDKVIWAVPTYPVAGQDG